MRFLRRPRLWPSTLAGRVAIVLILCLFGAGAVSIGAYIHDRAQATTRIFALSVADRIEAIVALMDETPPAGRGKYLRALNSPTLWVYPSETGKSQAEGGWLGHRRATQQVHKFLPNLVDRIRDIRVNGGPGAHFLEPPTVGGNPIPDLLPSRVKLLIAVALKDGSSLNFVVSSDTTSFRWAAHFGGWLVIAAVGIVLFSIWTAHRLTRPLRRFAEAADHLGLDVRAPPLPEHGSRELRRATTAFNRMQARIRRLVDDRTMMLAAISHDLRTILTRLRLRAEFIEEAEQRDKALGDIDDMQSMLEATLSFARDDTETEARIDLDIAALLQGLCGDLTDAGSRTDYEGPDRLVYRGGPVSLKRAFGNLLGNAAKYGGPATVTLSRGDDAIAVTVADRGPGIPVELREKVFQPFYRVEPSRNRETGGVGLGLSVARAILRRHGGDIVLDDREGGGLTVHVSLPEAADG